ncbi:MAG: class D sortase [Anaerolineae bacterium]|nr:class D sortase [Anaerolineae bacterium]
MRDKRPVDELSIEELERILRIRKREARLGRLKNYEGRQVAPERRDGRYSSARVLPTLVDDGDEAEPTPDLDAPPAAPLPNSPDAGAEALSAGPRRRHAEPVAPGDDAGAGLPAGPVPTRYYDGAPAFEDELDARLSPGMRRSGGRNWRAWWNRALTIIEVAAVVGLVALFVALLQGFDQLTRTTADLQAEFEATRRAQFTPPTATPMINIAAVVLPTGHTFVNDEAVFNLDEVPAQYRDQYVALAAQIPVSRPTPAPESPIRIRIPRINVDNAVVAGDDWEALKLGVGHQFGSANPGQRGNMVLSGHNDVFGEVFRRLDQLQPGDQIIVSTRSRDYTYVVQPVEERGQTRAYQIVRPTDTWVLGASGDVTKLTLVSCYPYRVNTRRIVVFATLQS